MNLFLSKAIQKSVKEKQKILQAALNSVTVGIPCLCGAEGTSACPMWLFPAALAHVDCLQDHLLLSQNKREGIQLRKP